MTDALKGGVSKISALDDFRTVRQRAIMETIMGQVTGKSTCLLSYDDVRQKLKAGDMAEKGMHEIPLDAIIGSVGRYTDFTRTYLPRRDNDANRWTNVKIATTGLIGLPPISVYQIGDGYFVIDGNHRVSVARQLDATTIEAHVTEVRTKVPLSKYDQLDDILSKAEYANFLTHTQLDETRPEADFTTTVPGRYWILEAQIDAHVHFIHKHESETLTYPEAAVRWHDEIYQPLEEAIRQQGMLRDFPQRTGTDFYIWIWQHRATLRERLGWDIEAEDALTDLSKHFGSRLPKVVERLTNWAFDIVVSNETRSDQPNKDIILDEPRRHLFDKILVAVTGNPKGWHALDFAIRLGKLESSKLRGLHISNEDDAAKSKKIQAEFGHRCENADIAGELAIESGVPANQINERAKWSHLVIVPMNHPPAAGLISRLSTSGLRSLIRRCIRPILVVPDEVSTIKRLLLSYDDSRKAKEALFISTYLAKRTNSSLVVLTVAETESSHDQDLVEYARTYLSNHEVPAMFVQECGEVVPAILRTIEAHDCHLTLMGGYRQNSVVGSVLDSNVDELLRHTQQPILICT
ncbi:universal stress protein [Anaerolineales bacterium HSG24]|nr:universal stress protein [Anaerolineales bacterium HSG24]